MEPLFSGVLAPEIASILFQLIPYILTPKIKRHPIERLNTNSQPNGLFTRFKHNVNEQNTIILEQKDDRLNNTFKLHKFQSTLKLLRFMVGASSLKFKRVEPFFSFSG